MSCTTWPHQRHYPRTPARLRVIYVHDGDYLISHSKNLSVDGMFVFTSAPPDVGQITQITFSIGDLPEMTVSARVAWVNHSESEMEAGMGVQFIDPPEGFQETVTTGIKRIALLPETSP